ncbi:F-box-like domain-containing protein [Pochonia chlamydosporia 170]|uniref:F-box-like domain-containing protein n=1 Tax=Pochonia chlamydosporia 170 TaxID=1380566 RepID=A0A179FAY3_METCM|nr:F-box-like domain-containing protein [Pochonia chlamydosporia 170]OAQ62695.1 F-box-like domain-containing protein [Pochonia chlamydosporia 170]
MAGIRAKAQHVIRILTSSRLKKTSEPRSNSKTRSKSHSTARAHPALQIPELLDLILWHLDPRTLLTTAQRVSRTWCQVIHTSPRLTRQLFSTPSLQPSTTQCRVFCPLVEDLFPGWIRVIDTTKDTKMGMKAFNTTKATLQFRNCLPFKASASDNPYLRNGASWMEMQVAHPPITNIAINIMYCNLQHSQTNLIQKTYPTGMRLLDLYALILQWVSRGCQPRRFQVVRAVAGNIQAQHIPLASMLFTPLFRPYNGIQHYKFDGLDADLFVELQTPQPCCPSPMSEEERQFWENCGRAFLETEYYERYYHEDY